MARHRFTTRFIDSIKPPSAGRADYWDAAAPGFGLRVSDSGRKTWVLMYRASGRLRRLTIGTYPALSLAGARDQAKAALADVARGGDPATHKKAEREAGTFAELAREYLDRHAKKKKLSWRKDAGALDRDLLPAFGQRKAKDLKRAEVIQLMDAIVERGAPIQANRTLEILRKVYNWGIGRGIVEANPCTHIDRPSKERRRERVLSDTDLRAVWGALDEIGPPMGTMFKLRLLTAQRGQEISQMRWPDMDLEAGWWTIPGEFTKNGLAHRVPLNPEAVELLRASQGLRRHPKWVFASSRTDRPIMAVWKAKSRVVEMSSVDFVLHDLRRTAASRMTGDLGIPRLTVAKVLNHLSADSGVTSTYDRHSYDREKRNALEAWGQRLDEIVAGRAAPADKVVQMR